MKKIGFRRLTPLLPAILIIAFMITMPLAWIRFFGTSIAPYHLFAALIIAIVPFLTGGNASLKAVLKAGKALWLSGGVIICAMLISFARPESPYEFFFFLKFAAFYLVALASAALMLLVIRSGLFGWFALVPAFVSAVFIMLISVQFALAQIDPISLFAEAIRRADPNIVIFQVFRKAFEAGQGSFEARSNLKQTIGLSFLVIIPIGLAALRQAKPRSPVVRLISHAGIAFAIFMTVFQFGRAAWLGLFLMLICYSLTWVRTSVGLFAVVGVILFVIPAATLLFSQSEVGELLETRLTSSESVEARSGATGEHWEAIGASPWLGSQRKIDKWAHNVVIDAWSAFGILGLVGALSFFLVLVTMVCRGLILILTGPIAHRHIHASIAALLTPAVVRMVTAPNVIIDFATWSGIGLAVGIAADAWASRYQAAPHTSARSVRRRLPSRPRRDLSRPT